MATIHAYSSVPNNRLASSPVNAATSPAMQTTADTAGASTATHTDSAPHTVSVLARQLSEASVRADTRTAEAPADPPDSIIGDSYLTDKAQHDAEVPDTDLPELLARARQATAFINGSDSNPFKGLGRDQLILIAHDDSGAFTTNERRAAWQEMESTAPAQASSASQASIDGHALMVARVFGNYEPPVAQPPLTSYNLTQSSYHFLNRDDRAVISQMYAYAQAEGADLAFVDDLAWQLGHYRHLSDGGQQLSHNNGYTSEGYRITFHFKEQDAAIASRILNGSAINSTRIDPGFLRHILNPDYGSLSNIGGIPFLEQMVLKFSAEGASQAALGSEFATFNRIENKDNVLVTTNTDTKLPPSKVVATNVNGVWSLTELGKSAGYTLDTATGKLHRPTMPPEDEAQQGFILETSVSSAQSRSLMDALADSDDPPAKRAIWINNLFSLLDSPE